MTQRRRKPGDAPDVTRRDTPAQLVAKALGLFHRQRAEAVKIAGQALVQARQQADNATAARALNLLADADRVEGRMDSASSLAREGLNLAAAAGDEQARADAINNLGLLAWHRAEFDRAIERFTEALAIREQLKNDHDVAATCSNLSLVHWEKGNLALAMDYQQRSLEIKERIGDRYGIGISQLNRGLIFVDLGDWDKALECYFRALTEKEYTGDKSDIALCYNNIGEVYLKRGQLDRARFHLERALELAMAAPSAWTQAEALGNLGEAALLAGDMGRARDCYERDRRLCIETDDREELAETQRRWAELDLAQGRLDECRARLDEALELCTRAGSMRELGNVHRVRGEMLVLTGDSAGAEQALEQSREVFRTLGKSYELGLALAALGRLRREQGSTEWRNALSEALSIFRNLGAEGKVREAELLLASDAGGEPAITAAADTVLLRELADLACSEVDLTRFCGAALTLVVERLPAEGAAILLRDGRVFQQGTGAVQPPAAAEQDTAGSPPEAGRTAIPLEAGGRRAGTLLLRAEVEPGQLKTLAGLIALGVCQAQARPAGATCAARGAGTQRKYPGIIGSDTTLAGVFETVERAAPTRATVLILGESGTGKELVARTLHELSDRRDKPLVVVNCAAIPETLLESELFGIEQGTATGVAGRKGKFELAAGGTVFLDEIGDMSPKLQAKVLRLLQDRTFERVGGRQPLNTDVRIVAATNRNLEQAMAESKFRPDLYYRLNVITINLPPLRERKQDIPALAASFIDRFSREYCKPVHDLAEDTLACLTRHDWPGNVRELENVIERGVILARSELVTVADLPANLRAAAETEPGWREVRKAAREAAAAPIERETILAALDESGWVVKNAAEHLHISRREIYRLIKKHSIHRPSPNHQDSTDRP